jgi:ABC-type maltose transport system permease subunit
MTATRFDCCPWGLNTESRKKSRNTPLPRSRHVADELLALQASSSLLALVAYYLILLRLGLTNTHLGLILDYSSLSIVFNVWKR